MTEKKVISDKNVLFALTEPTLHYIKVAPESEEYLKIWIKEPTWLESEKALNAVMKIDTRTQNLDLDLNAMYRYMMENFITKTEPSLSSVDMLRLSPFIGNQIKAILPNPMTMLQEDEEKKGLIKKALKGGSANLKTASLIMVYSLSSALHISPLEVYKMPVSLVKDLLSVHGVIETLKAEEYEKMKNRK